MLFCFERPGTYPTLQPIIARQVRADLIRDNWDQVIRPVAYLERATNALRAAGYDLPDDKLVHVAPLSWEHINLTGDYAWGEAGFSQVGQRPLGTIPSLMAARAA